MLKGKSGKPSQKATILYEVRIEKWHWSYHLLLNRRSIDQPMHEFRHLEVLGPLTSLVLPKVSEVKISLVPDRAMDPERPVREPLEFIGSMRLRNGCLHVLQGTPADVLPSLLIGLSTGHLRYCSISGTALRN
jgi:hypothetical protein